MSENQDIKQQVIVTLVPKGTNVEVSVEFDPPMMGSESEQFARASYDQKRLQAMAAMVCEGVLEGLKSNTDERTEA